MTKTEIIDRIEEGSPFRLGELATAAGYSREYVRKLADAEVLKTQRPSRAGAHRRVDVVEAERFLRSEGRL